MPRQNFISVPVSDNIQAIFDEFVKAKDITKTAALTDMIELYMLATDEELYVELKKKHLKLEKVKEIIKANEEVFDDEGDLFNTYLFMKLGYIEDKNGKQLNGPETMDLYMNDQKVRGYTWFSTESLFYGMSKRQVSFFKRAIERGYKVQILFAIGRDAGGDNNIQYIAEVLDLNSSSGPSSCPEQNAFPNTLVDKARIWVKIKDLRHQREISVNDLVVKSTGNPLKEVITNSQYHFGYVTKQC